MRSHNLGDVSVVTNSLGDPAGLSVQSTLSGPVFVPHEDGTIETFEDSIALRLGGRAGFFTFDGQEVCVSDSGCGDSEAESQVAAQSSVSKSDAQEDREFCTTVSSFDPKRLIPFFHFNAGYCSRGGDTKQGA